MKDNKGLYILIAILFILVLALGGYIVYDKLLSSNNININNESKNNESTITNEETKYEEEKIEQKESTKAENKIDYSGESFIGSYQLLNEMFDNSKLDLEVQLLSNGTIKVAYNLNNNGNITSKQYNGTYTIKENLDMEINGDHYKVLKINYDSSSALSDKVISKLSTNMTYQPANNPENGEDQHPKALLLSSSNAGNLFAYLTDDNNLKYIK